MEGLIHFTYKTTCISTGKFYVGMHSGLATDNYLGSGVRLRNSIKKYGKDDHVRVILKIFLSREEMVKAEIELITEELLANPMCMNLIPGGLGGFDKHSEESKQKMRKSAALRDSSHYVTGERHGMFGKQHTEEAKLRQIAGLKRPRGANTREHNLKLSLALKEHFKNNPKVISQEQRAKLSLALKAAHARKRAINTEQSGN